MVFCWLFRGTIVVRAQSLPRVRGRHGGTMAAVRHPEAAARERHGNAIARTAGMHVAPIWPAVEFDTVGSGDAGRPSTYAYGLPGPRSFLLQ